MIVNEKYKLNKEWLDLLLEHKNNANVTFNLSNNDTRILLTYIEVLQQENARLKDKIEKVIECVNHYETIRGYYEYEECGYDEYNYEEDLKEELLELLKEN